jgi:hypothetical protein
MRACACVSALTCVCIGAQARGRVCMCVDACSLAYQVRNAHAPYCTAIYGLSGSTTVFGIAHKRHYFRKKRY